MDKDISTTLVIIFLLIILLYIVTILVLGAKIQVINKEVAEWKDDYKELQDSWLSDYRELHDQYVSDITDIKLSHKNQIDKLEEVIHNLEKNK